MSIYDKPKTFSLTTFYNAKIKFMWAGYYKQSIFGYISYYYSVMDYEYSVIGSIYCNAEVLATMAASSEFLHNGYTFLLRKFNGQLSVSLVGYASGNTSDNNIQNVRKICLLGFHAQGLRSLWQRQRIQRRFRLRGHRGKMVFCRI